MNKFFAISLLAFACCLVDTNAEYTQATDEQEVAQLTDRNILFADFCLATRDHVTGTLRARGQEFLVIPSTVLNLLNDTANSHRNIKARLNQIIENPDAELKKLDNYVAEQQKSLGQKLQDQAPAFQASEIYNRARKAGEQAKERFRGFLKDPSAHLQRVDGLIAEQQRALGQKIQGSQFQPGAFFRNAYEGIQSMANRIRSAPKTLAAETCNAVDQFEQEISRRFEETKKELAARGDSSVAGMKLNEVPCATIARIQSIVNACAEIRKKE